MRALASRRLAFLVLALVCQRAAAEPATYRVTRAARPPKIDGRLDDACWKTACVVDSFGLLGAKPADRTPTVKTTAWLTYDADALYVAYRCEEPLADQLALHAEKHDGATWSDDSVELFFNPSGDRRRYCQIAVNAAGVIMDNYGDRSTRTLDVSYETGAAAAARIGKREWTLEVRIPFAGLPVEELACPWTFHLARHRSAAGQLLTSLRSPVDGFHELESFDVLEGISLAERRVAVRDVSLGDMLQGINHTTLTLANASAGRIEATVAAGVAGAKPPYRAERKVVLAPRRSATVTVPWELSRQHAGRREFVSVSVGGKVIRRRERLIEDVPPVFGTLRRSVYFLDPNEFVRLGVPIHLARGSRGLGRLEWTAADAAGKVVGRGSTTVYGDRAVLRLYWPRWVEGHYTIKMALTRRGRPVAARQQTIRLVASPWAGI